MPDVFFLQIKSRRITLPEPEFNNGDLIMVRKVTKVEMENYFMDLQKKNEQRIINQFQNEKGDVKNE